MLISYFRVVKTRGGVCLLSVEIQKKNLQVGQNLNIGGIGCIYSCLETVSCSESNNTKLSKAKTGHNFRSPRGCEKRAQCMCNDGFVLVW